MPDTAALAVTTPSACEITFTRTFAAPRPLVWRAMHEPALIRRWLGGPEGWEMTVCEVDLRVGGRYRYEWRKQDGTVMGMGGTYEAVTPPSRLVSIEQFDEAWYPGQARNTIELEDLGGTRTVVQLTCQYESQEARDIAMQSGMESGMRLGYERLERLLHDLRP